MPQLVFIFEKILVSNFDEPKESEKTVDYCEVLGGDWLSFWTTKGEDIVHNLWTLKYSDYLLQEDVEDQRDDTSTQKHFEKHLEVQINGSASQELHEDGDNYPANILTQKHFDNHLEKEISGSSWQELWDEHFDEVYRQTYELYQTVHYHQYSYYRLTAERVLEESEESSSVTEEEQVDYIAQLKALGLPTSFGGRNNKYDNSRLEDSYSELSTDEEGMTPVTEQTDTHLKNTKKKKKNRKLRHIPKLIRDDKSLRTYWQKRFSLFSRFDEGIQLDRESWFSVTPEKVAIHMAERLRCGTIIDAFCGSGGNAIQFATTCSKVIAIDIDEEKIKNARHNANIYGVSDKIDFIIGDFLHLCDSLKGDVVFLSPPWGGPKYISKKEYDIEESLAPIGASVLAEKSRQISDNIAFFLPKNSRPQQIVKVAGIGHRVDIEHNYLDTRLVGLTAIYGDWLIDKKNFSD